MPDPALPGGDMSSCIDHFMDAEDMDEESAAKLCQSLREEEQSDYGDVAELREAIENGAGLIADVGVDLLSGVDVPAVDSKWIMTKSGAARKGHDYRARSPILLSKAEDEDQRISYAAAMIPREPDKEGDVVATPTVEAAAHDFLKSDGGVDTDHSLIDGEGEVVESWVLKQERTFDLPGGATETYGPGTWMVGIEWGADAWERIQNGDITGLSIYGMAEHVPLERAVKCAECGAPTADTHKRGDTESDGMAPDDSGESAETADGGGEEPTIGEVAASVDAMQDTVESLKEVIETDKQDTQEAAAVLADEYDMPTGDIVDILDAAARHELEDVLDALDSVSEQEPVEDAKEDDEDDEEEMEESAEKRADDAHLEKGTDARQVAAKAHGDTGAGDMSWHTAKQKYAGDDQ